ncbi:hypothetical protein Hanom_Chr16g01501311 [Helianthus anomalus]
MTTNTNNFVVRTICLIICQTHKTNCFTNFKTSVDRWDECQLFGGGIKYVIPRSIFASFGPMSRAK